MKVKNNQILKIIMMIKQLNKLHTMNLHQQLNMLIFSKNINCQTNNVYAFTTQGVSIRIMLQSKIWLYNLQGKKQDINIASTENVRFAHQLRFKTFSLYMIVYHYCDGKSQEQESYTVLITIYPLSSLEPE